MYTCIYQGTRLAPQCRAFPLVIHTCSKKGIIATYLNDSCNVCCDELANYLHLFSKYCIHTYVSYLALVITNGPMNVTVCSGATAEISCGFTGVSASLFNIRPDWRIIKKNISGHVIENKTVNQMDIDKTDGLIFTFTQTAGNGIYSANNSYLSVGPVDDTYNNTSYQCMFTINDTIIESDTATITVIGTFTHIHTYIHTYSTAHFKLDDTHVQQLHGSTHFQKCPQHFPRVHERPMTYYHWKLHAYMHETFILLTCVA